MKFINANGFEFCFRTITQYCFYFEKVFARASVYNGV